ncbi:hypothetical protein V5O48_007015 [Marasmius crinis-equi]|uniref:BTB domain-containing protein n=1 Tax=Marasmius crinis-equi TaxID=585013 RepID=A0ABR3FHV6_9AGAR
MSDDLSHYHDAQNNVNMDLNYNGEFQSSGSGLHSPLSPTSNSEFSVRKRKRSDTGETTVSEAQAAGGLIYDMEAEGTHASSSRYSKQPVTLKRDPTYYFEDGSCVLLVQDTLFNVHRTILSKDNSSFSTMFTLPQGSTEAEGRSDDNPIVLTGDRPSEFRNFLWALYSLPPDLCVVYSSSADLNLLIDIARISNKYSFKSLETWSLDAVQGYVDRKPSPLLNGLSNSPTLPFSGAETSLVSDPPHVPGIENTTQLTRLFQLAQLCGHEQLLATMISLLRQLMGKSLQYAYLAITLADDLDLRALRGAAYLEVMQKSTVVRRGGSTLAIANEGDLDEDGRLVISPAQQLRLLTGYWHLTRTWERLRGAPPHFVHASSCGATWHQHGCTQSWVEFWKDKTKGDAVLGLGLADVIGRLKQVQKDYDRWGSATYMHHDCRVAARRSIIELIRHVEDKLPDYFSDEGCDADDEL